MTKEIHTVKRAIIMAAGIGKRLQPLTFETPKPLVRINGIRMMDTVINALHQNGINEIYVVVGHLKEKFTELPKQYNGLQLIENPYYKTCNNISSLYVAREHLEDCMILDGDQIIHQPSVLTPEFLVSGYNVVRCEGKTREWLLSVKNDIITGCSRTGGSNGWQLYSISRWTDEDGRKLKHHLEYEFEHGNTDIYWDDVAMFCHFDEYTLGIREMRDGDVVEIDDLNELIQVDQTYRYLERKESEA